MSFPAVSFFFSTKNFISFLAVQYTGDKCSLLCLSYLKMYSFCFQFERYFWRTHKVETVLSFSFLKDVIYCLLVWTVYNKSVVSLYHCSPQIISLFHLKILLFKIFFSYRWFCSNLIMVYLSISFLVIYLASWISGFMVSITSEKILLCLQFFYALISLWHFIYSNACYCLIINT